jgi:hypothetical protein
MLLRVIYFALLFAANFASAHERTLTFRSKWIELGENGHEIRAEYVVIESVELESFISLHHPGLRGLERSEKIGQLRERKTRAVDLIEVLGTRYKQKAARHRALTPSYEADIDQRIELAKEGKARLVALLGEIGEGSEQPEVFAMAAIFPDFGNGVLLQADSEPVLHHSPEDVGEPRKERVRIFGSAEAGYLDENIQLGELASDTSLFWGDIAAIGLFTVPRDTFHVPGSFGWNPPNVHRQVVDWKGILLNLAVADGLIRFGERSVPGGSYQVPMSSEQRAVRQRAFSEIGKAPYLPPELVGAGPQAKIGISQVILFTRSETLAELLYKPLGASLSRTRAFGGDGALQYDMKISREDLEAVTLEKLRNSIRTTNPYFDRIHVTPNFTYEHSPSNCSRSILEQHVPLRPLTPILKN